MGDQARRAVLETFLVPLREPVFAVEGADVIVFGTVAKAERYLEAQDVEDNGYEFYDANGTEYRLKTVKDRVVVLDEPFGTKAQHLESILRYHLLATPERVRNLDDAAVRDSDLQALSREMLRLKRG